MPDPKVVLTALAELAPAGGDRVLDVTVGNQPLAWLTGPIDRAGRGRVVDRLAALDALHRDERVLRLGIGFVLGVTTVDGVVRKVRLPLLTRPVRLERSRGGYRVVSAGDLEVTSLLLDPTRAAEYESSPGLGDPRWPTMVGARSWVTSVATAAGLPVRGVQDTPPAKMPDDRLVGVTAAALFVAGESARAGVRGTLRDWASRPGLDATALAAVYADEEPDAAQRSRADAGRRSPADAERSPAAPADDEVLSPLPLNASQREVVRRARTERVTVVSGPPGNGKSHAVVAAALDVVARGGSVLVATQSTHAAAVLCDLLARYPGPAPVAFGDAERRAALVLDLGAGTPAAVDDRALREARKQMEQAASRVRGLHGAIRDTLAVEVLAAAADRWQPLVPALGADVPGAFEPGTDLDRAAALAARDGWFARWRLRRMLGQRPDLPHDRVLVALEAGRAVRAEARLVTAGGTDLEKSWDALAEADARLAEAVGAWMRAASRGVRRWTPAGRRAAQSLAGALRAGRNRRRELLGALDGPALIAALPLWVGTVTDVEDLLPPVAGVFDLVILDEASHIDQLRAAPVLVRARRALVVGDPRQLRFVSFTSDVEVSDTLARHGLDDRVDVRRMSAFDLAAGASPVTWLAEHYRGAPHLIGFSAHRFYADRFTVATRHPRNDGADVIDVVRVDGASTVDGVCRAEVDAVLGLVDKLARDGVRGIGVVSPFRAQADALEAALLNTYQVAEIESLGLRVGTVHAFQGSEAPVVLVSLGLTDGDAAARGRFAADPNLFNVMVTRGRERLVVVTGLTAPAGIVAEFLAYSEKPPDGVAGSPVGAWPAALAAEMERLGAPAFTGYPVGPWTVDVCAGERGFLTDVHPDGPDAHIERQRALRAAGWHLVDAFASRWSGDPVRAALELVATEVQGSNR